MEIHGTHLPPPQAAGVTILPISASTCVRSGTSMVLPLPESPGSGSPSGTTPGDTSLPEGRNPEDWPYLERGLLIASRSSRVCLTCHWFRHAAPPESLPLLTCERHRGLLVHGEHLTRRCQGWSADRQGGWAPEAA
jgi:hypothetical protein